MVKHGKRLRLKVKPMLPLASLPPSFRPHFAVFVAEDDGIGNIVKVEPLLNNHRALQYHPRPQGAGLSTLQTPINVHTFRLRQPDIAVRYYGNQGRNHV